MRQRFRDRRTTWEKAIARRPWLKRLVVASLAFLLGASLTFVANELLFEEIAVFGFHDIVDLDDPNQRSPLRPEFSGDYSQQDFDTFVRSLVARDYWFLSADDLYNHFLKTPADPIPPERRGQPKVLLSFDDGYQGAHDNVLPVLEQIARDTGRRVTVVWFVPSSFMGVPGTDLDHASCDDLRSGVSRGFYDVQSHTANHQDLTQLSAADLDKELRRSQRELRQCLRGLRAGDRVANHIAYPFGRIDRSSLAAVRRYYRSGYLYNDDPVRLAPYRHAYRLPRVTVSRHDSVRRLLRIAAGGWL